MANIKRWFRGDILLVCNQRYKLSAELKEQVLSCDIDFIPFALSKRPDFKSDIMFGSMFIFDESSILYRCRYDGWELWRFFDKDTFKFIKGWLYRPLKNEEDTVKTIWLLNVCLDFKKV